MEDVAFPVESLADGITDLENLLEKYRYDKDIAGHALTGIYILIYQQTSRKMRKFSVIKSLCKSSRIWL